MGCHSLLQEIFPTQGSNPGLLHCRQVLYHLSHQGYHFSLRGGKSQNENLPFGDLSCCGEIIFDSKDGSSGIICMFCVLTVS